MELGTGLGLPYCWREADYLPGGWSLMLAGGTQGYAGPELCFLYCHVCFPCGPSNLLNIVAAAIVTGVSGAGAGHCLLLERGVLSSWRLEPEAGWRHK